MSSIVILQLGKTWYMMIKSSLVFQKICSMNIFSEFTNKLNFGIWLREKWMNLQSKNLFLLFHFICQFLLLQSIRFNEKKQHENMLQYRTTNKAEGIWLNFHEKVKRLFSTFFYNSAFILRNEIRRKRNTSFFANCLFS